MTTSTNVTVIIVNYNSGELLEQCLSALNAQTFTEFATIVVDNASTDGSAERLQESYNNVKWILANENLGFSKGNNLGIGKAKDSRWIALLNPDAIPKPDWLANLMNATEQNPEFTFFGSHMVNHPQEDRVDGTGDIYHVSGLAWRRDHGKPAKMVDRKQEEIFAPCAAAALYLREAILEAGGFDDSFFCYMEDVDLSFRLRLLGYRCLYVPSSVVAHVGSASSGWQSDFCVYHGHRNLVWTYFKNMPEPLLWLYLPQHLLANLAGLVWFSFRGKAGTIFKAKRDALKGLGVILKKRKEIRSKRKVSNHDLLKVMTHGLLKPYLKNL